MASLALDPLDREHPDALSWSAVAVLAAVPLPGLLTAGDGVGSARPTGSAPTTFTGR